MYKITVYDIIVKRFFCNMAYIKTLLKNTYSDIDNVLSF